MTTRAKVRVESVKLTDSGEEVQMRAVCKSGKYPVVAQFEIGNLNYDSLF